MYVCLYFIVNVYLGTIIYVFKSSNYYYYYDYYYYYSFFIQSFIYLCMHALYYTQMSLILRTWRHQAVYGSVEGMYSRTALTKSLSEQKTLGNALQKIVANQTIVSICIYIYVYV